MAKDKDKEKKAQTSQVTEDSVMDEIRKGNLIDEEVIKIGDEKDAEDEKERKVREYRKAKNQAKYTNRKALLELRQRRREEKATHEWLNETKSLFNQLCGGEITPSEYKEERRKAAEKKTKAFRDSDAQFSKELRELQNAFPGYWSYEWDY